MAVIINRNLFKTTLFIAGGVSALCLVTRCFLNSRSLFPQERRVPPISSCDTVVFSLEEGTIRAIGGRDKGVFFQDSEIVERLDVIRKEMLPSSIEARYTRHGKVIVQQQAMRACTAAASAMLILDHQKTPDFDSLKTRNLGLKEDILRDIKGAKLKPLVQRLHSLADLEKSIQKYGSAIVGVGGELGNHCVVVDAVSQKGVRLRDPYHGWEITVSSKAFLKRWRCSEEIIQVNS